MRRLKGFTLVELLVVIGIIALLISILLPSLNKARRQAVATQCLSNEHMIGLAIMQYSNAFNGVVIPCTVWNSGAQNTNSSGNSGPDFWAHLLVQGKYLPDPNIGLKDGAQSTAKTVLVCPAVRDTLINTNISGVGPTNPSAVDGFDRRQSAFIVANRAGVGVVVDFGYGINGCVNPDNGSGGLSIALMGQNSWFDLPSTAIAYDNGASGTFPPTHKMTKFRSSSQTVLLFDGSEWNPINGAQRISGGRHGNFEPNRPYDTGTCNLLFLDFHSEAAPRNALPTPTGPFPNGAGDGTLQFVGNRSYSRSAKYLWSTDQQ